MFKTYAKCNAEKGRTIPISVNGKVRFISPETKASVLNDWRSAGGARYAAVLDGEISNHIREFDLYESPGFDYVIHTHDGGLSTLEVVASNLSLSDKTATYRNNPSWQPL
jgi:hypothetical protein